jgi:hypothetical protein
LRKILPELELVIAQLEYTLDCMFGLVEMDTAKHGTIRYAVPFDKEINVYDPGLYSSSHSKIQISCTFSIS